MAARREGAERLGAEIVEQMLQRVGRGPQVEMPELVCDGRNQVGFPRLDRRQRLFALGCQGDERRTLMARIADPVDQSGIEQFVDNRLDVLAGHLLFPAIIGTLLSASARDSNIPGGVA